MFISIEKKTKSICLSAALKEIFVSKKFNSLVFEVLDNKILSKTMTR